MYNKKCEKTFEILRSEITSLMDLYIPCIQLHIEFYYFIYTENILFDSVRVSNKYI